VRRTRRRCRRAVKQSPDSNAIKHAIQEVGYHIASAIKLVDKFDRDSRLWAHYGPAQTKFRGAKIPLQKAVQALKQAKGKLDPWG
jgi:hypothetical protein